MSDILERLRVQARSGLMFLPHDFKVVSYGETADEIARLRTALSEAERRARREALEEAAMIVDSVASRPLQGPEQGVWERAERQTAKRLAAAIRALIPSEPHDAEGRN